ncbi:MAG: ATP-binding protein [Acidobacteriota bacterium]
MVNSVRVRLTLWYVLLFGLLLAGFSILVYLVLSQTLYARLDQSLLRAAQAVAGEFRSEVAESEEGAPSGARQALIELRLPGIYVGIFDGEQLLASNFDGDHQITIPKELLSTTPTGDHPTFRTVEGYGEEGARVAAISAHTSGKDYLVVAAEPLHDLVEQLESIRRIFYLGFPASLLVAGIGGFILAKKSLAPVVAMSNQAELISARNLHERLSVGNKSDELGHLARVFNDLLSRLDSSFESMREFMADASHELRTPLSIIRGEADVALSQDRDATEYREALATIQDEAKRLSRIVDDMMALARADAGQRPLQIEEFYLNDLVEECCKAARVLALNDGVSLTFDPTEDIAFRGDEDLLRRMVLNLLDNAIKYTPPGGSISVKLACESTTVKIVVSDTGIGITADSAPHVFERFYRVDKARSRADGGSGLGLAIAKWVAEAHKGSIDLTSSPGHGSRFTVSLPR